MLHTYTLHPTGQASSLSSPSSSASKRPGETPEPDEVGNAPHPRKRAKHFYGIPVVNGVMPPVPPSHASEPEQQQNHTGDNASLYSEPSTLDPDGPPISVLIRKSPSQRFSLLDDDEISNEDDHLPGAPGSRYGLELRRVQRVQQDHERTAEMPGPSEFASRYGFPLSQSDEVAFRRLSSWDEEIRNRPDSPPPGSQAAVQQRKAEDARLFARLPRPLRDHISIIAAEAGTRRSPGAVREKTMCGREMWVKRESGKVKWRVVNWASENRDTQQHISVTGTASEGAPPNQPLEQDEADHMSWCTDVDAWDGMEDLGPVHSRSVPWRIRERALRRRNNRHGTIFAGMTQAIRGLFSRSNSRSSDFSEDEACKDTKRFSLKEFFARPWRKRGSHDSAICLDADGQHRKCRWDRVGPKNEQLLYSFEDLPVAVQPNTQARWVLD